jgi:hypothetical protein
MTATKVRDALGWAEARELDANAPDNWTTPITDAAESQLSALEAVAEASGYFSHAAPEDVGTLGDDCIIQIAVTVKGIRDLRTALARLNGGGE